MNYSQKNISVINQGYQDLNPLSCGEQHCPPLYGPKLHIYKYYLIHYIVSGCGKLFTEEKTYTLQPGNAFLICPGECSTYQADEDNPWHYIWIGFQGNLCYLLNNLTSPVFHIDSGVFFDMLISREKKSMRETYLAGCLFSLLSEMLDSASTQSSAERALNYINVHYMHKLSIQDLAQMLNINSCYLSRTFKKQYGITMQSYLNKLRMQEAQRLLINSEPVARVASLIGYHDPFLFSKQFKKYAGISPKQFMIKHQK